MSRRSIAKRPVRRRRRPASFFVAECRLEGEKTPVGDAAFEAGRVKRKLTFRHPVFDPQPKAYRPVTPGRFNRLPVSAQDEQADDPNEN